jgi:hypothetical protein
MALWKEAVVSVGSHIVLTADIVANKEEKVFLCRFSSLWASRKRQEARTHIVFATLRPFGVALIEDMAILPRVEVGRLEEIEPIPLFGERGIGRTSDFVQNQQIPREHIVTPTLLPDIGGVCGAKHNGFAVCIRCLRDPKFGGANDGVCRQLFPHVIGRCRALRETDPACAPQHPVGEIGGSVFIYKSPSAKTAFIALSGTNAIGVMTPMKQV